VVEVRAFPTDWLSLSQHCQVNTVAQGYEFGNAVAKDLLLNSHDKCG